jgi:hypothetical protein
VDAGGSAEALSPGVTSQATSSNSSKNMLPAHSTSSYSIPGSYANAGTNVEQSVDSHGEYDVLSQHYLTSQPFAGRREHHEIEVSESESKMPGGRIALINPACNLQLQTQLSQTDNRQHHAQNTTPVLPIPFNHETNPLASLQNAALHETYNRNVSQHLHPLQSHMYQNPSLLQQTSGLAVNLNILNTFAVTNNPLAINNDTLGSLGLLGHVGSLLDTINNNSNAFQASLSSNQNNNRQQQQGQMQTQMSNEEILWRMMQRQR